MRKASIKRAAKLSRVHLPLKPYGFCCEKQTQDPEKRYDMRNPPFASSLTDVILDGGGPAVKFRVQDSGRLPFVALLQRRTQLAHLGRCKRCRGPLLWYLEDEISLAHDIFAKERLDNYERITKRNLKIAMRKGSLPKGSPHGTRERLDRSIVTSILCLVSAFFPFPLLPIQFIFGILGILFITFEQNARREFI
ncbi:hypothetical protein HN011_011851 [Eciton burchellii]|nr:hypothetical protein HN011_011851 [Eciton burchellii]